MMNMVENNQDNWVVILGDQIGSRIVDNREQELIATRQRVEEMNDLLKDRLIVPLSVSRGDEVQALVQDPATAWEIIETFDTKSSVNSFRYTIGIGTLSTGLSISTWEMDGPCFHKARDAMERAKHEKRWVTINGLGNAQDTIVNGMIRSLQLIREGWTKRQREAYAVRRHAELQQAAAEQMGLDQSTLSKMLKAAHYSTYMELEDALRNLITIFWGRKNHD